MFKVGDKVILDIVKATKTAATTFLRGSVYQIVAVDGATGGIKFDWITSPNPSSYWNPKSFILYSASTLTPSSSVISTNNSKVINRKDCAHKWEKYVGFTDIYKFCIHCDTKQAC